MRGLVEESVVEHWFLSYIDLLQRLKLFTIANEVRGHTIDYLGIIIIVILR